ncbi:hypothetical protein BO82DRAFT_349603, partial [Aspergillus uvarum CBS 121591]
MISPHRPAPASQGSPALTIRHIVLPLSSFLIHSSLSSPFRQSGSTFFNDPQPLLKSQSTRVSGHVDLPAHHEAAQQGLAFLPSDDEVKERALSGHLMLTVLGRVEGCAGLPVNTTGL